MQVDRHSLLQQLTEGCQQLGLPLAEPVKQQLIDYVQLLHKWNKTYNLTAVRDLQQMVSRHLLDSLSILPWIRGERCIDVGSGPGLPGLVLAIAEAGRRQWTLLDSNGKKIRFLRQAVAELGLENIDIIQERVEKFQPDEKFDTLTTRAFASLGDMIQWSHHLIAGDGHRGTLLAMKGSQSETEQELAEANSQITELLDNTYHASIEALHIPGSDAQRHLVIIETDQINNTCSA